MKGIVYHGPGDVRYETIDDPSPPDARGATVRVTATAICGSDLHMYHGHTEPGRRGIAMGHECIGEVVETGSDVHRFRAGDRVLVAGVIGCGECRHCTVGRVAICERRLTRVFGWTDMGGGQAEALAVPDADHALRAIPSGMSDKDAVLLTDILPTGYMGSRQAQIQPGDSVAVVGMGPVGQMALETAMLFGPAKVFALDRIEHRLEAAARAGAIPVNVDTVDPVAFVRQETGGFGVHAVVEAAGPDETVQLAFRLLRSGGTLSMVGVSLTTSFPLNLALAQSKDITIRASLCSVPMFWNELVPLVESGRLNLDRVFTHSMAMSEGAAAYDLFDRRADGVIKVMLDPAR